jgi:hypothetical protein
MVDCKMVSAKSLLVLTSPQPPEKIGTGSLHGREELRTLFQQGLY